MLTPPSHSRIIADALPDARFVEVPGAGHMVMMEAPGRRHCRAAQADRLGVAVSDWSDAVGCRSPAARPAPNSPPPARTSSSATTRRVRGCCSSVRRPALRRMRRVARSSAVRGRRSMPRSTPSACRGRRSRSSTSSSAAHPRNRRPLPQEMANCRGWLDRQLALIDPAVIVGLGLTAIAGLWDGAATAKKSDFVLRLLRERPLTASGYPFLATYHPSGALRYGPNGAPMQALRDDLARARAMAAGSRSMITLATADDTRALGARIAGLVRPGDLIVLDGPLGAGKTVFVQGLAAGLGAAGRVTSPTFVIARVHEGGRLPLVHVDAYRLHGRLEIDDLDLDTDLAGLSGAVVAVEWGAGLVEGLTDAHLRVRAASRRGRLGRARTIKASGRRCCTRSAAIGSSGSQPPGWPSPRRLEACWCWGSIRRPRRRALRSAPSTRLPGRSHRLAAPAGRRSAPQRRAAHPAHRARADRMRPRAGRPGRDRHRRGSRPVHQPAGRNRHGCGAR